MNDFRAKYAPLSVLILAFGYAFLRYVLFKGVSPEHLPLYVTNKACCLAGLVLIGMAPLLSDPNYRKQWGLFGFALTGGHVLISVLILNPDYFGNFYSPAGKMTWQAELAMLSGIVGWALLVWLFCSTLIHHTVSQSGLAFGLPRVGRGILMCAGLHVLAMGYAGWIDVNGWPGYLPPISLISFLIAGAFLIARFATRGSAEAEWKSSAEE